MRRGSKRWAFLHGQQNRLADTGLIDIAGKSEQEHARKLEILAAAAWPAETKETVQGWSLGFTHGVTRRANSVLPLEWDGKGLGTAIDEVEHHYRDHDLRPCFKMSPAALPPGLAGALAERGYRAEGESDVLVAEPQASAASSFGDLNIRLLDKPEPDWIEACWSAREKEVPVLLALVKRIMKPRIFALAERDGAPTGAALAVAEDGWAGITAVNTLPAYRRAGVARGIMDALTGWAGERGQGSIYLQVERDNAAARALYDGLGYRHAYSYHYLVAPPPAAGA